MNKQYERMKALLQETGITFTEGGISDAEIYAYSSVLHSLEDRLDTALSQLFYLSSGAEPYCCCALTGIPVDTPQRQVLLDEMLHPDTGNVSHTGFERAFQASGGTSYSLENGVFTPEYESEVYLPLLGRFVRQYLPFYFRSVCSGSGMCFDDWDAWGKPFDEYDRFTLPFNMIDTLRKDTI